MNIDWGKAPEGATHWDPVDQNWLRQFSGVALGWLNGRGWEPKGWQYPDDLSTIPRLVARPDWNGEGLPPVGMVCEFCRFPEKCGAKWSKVAIVAHWEEGLGSPVAIFMSTGYAPQADQAVADRFRPIRTAEQIAAEDRENAIDEMSGWAGKTEVNPATERLFLERLYDAGYRKQVQP